MGTFTSNPAPTAHEVVDLIAAWSTGEVREDDRDAVDRRLEAWRSSLGQDREAVVSPAANC
ncbi:MAG TPA: hypothetical protein VF715_03250 [Thermoleophilaceae bacterium]|jgi:hypothetical protein